MIIKDINTLLNHVKKIILEVDSTITEKKIFTSGQFIEKEGSFDKTKFAPYYTIFFDVKVNSSFLINKSIIKGDFIISKVIVLNEVKKPNIYSFIDNTIKSFIQKIKEFLAINRIQYSNLEVKTITANDPIITVEIKIKDLIITTEV